MALATGIRVALLTGMTGSAIMEYSEDGNFNTDVFSIYVWKGLAEQCEEVCKAGDLLAIRGRLEGKCKMEGKEEEYLSRIIAEKITFLTIKGKENGFVY